MSALPTYITSGASSRAHHAYLAKLHQSQSQSASSSSGVPTGFGAGGEHGKGNGRDEESIVEDEVIRCLKTLGGRGVSNKVVAETLIILLHTTYTAYTSPTPATPPLGENGDSITASSKGKQRERDTLDPMSRATDPDAALVAALQLAASSKSLYEKRVGYLYLAERMSRGHELGLMFINTIRKDLSSDKPAVIVLALHAIIKSPSEELSPAVIPLLISKAILRHPESVIRQKAIQALIALHFEQKDHTSASQGVSTRAVKATTSFPLSMGKVARMLHKEQDLGVVRVLISLIWRMISSHAHKIASADERAYLLDLVMLSARPDGAVRHILAIEGKRCVSELLDGTPSLVEAVDTWLSDIVRTVATTSASSLGTAEDIALLLPTSELLHRHTQLPNTSSALMRCLTSILAEGPRRSASPRIRGRSVSTSSLSSAPTDSGVKRSPGPAPNHLILVTRCLSLIPIQLWDGRLTEEAMAVVLSGLEHTDEAVRKATLRLLLITSPDTIQQHFDQLLDDIARPSRSTGKNRLGEQYSTLADFDLCGAKAIEVLEVQSSAIPDVDVANAEQHCDAAADVARLAQGVLRLFQAASEARQPGQEPIGSEPVRLAFLLELVRHGGEYPVTPEVSLLRAAMVCEHVQALQEEVDVVLEALLRDVAAAEIGESSRELALVAIAAVLANRSAVATETTRQLKELLQHVAGLPVVHLRLRQIIELDHAGRLGQVRDQVQGQTLPAYFTAFTTAYNAYQQDLAREKRSEVGTTGTAKSPRAMGDSKDLSASRLRYDAYAPPQVIQMKRKDKGRKSQGAGDLVRRQSKEGRRMDGSVREDARGDVVVASEETGLLFDSDQALEEEVEQINKLNLSNQTISSSNRRISDPFRF